MGLRGTCTIVPKPPGTIDHVPLHPKCPLTPCPGIPLFCLVRVLELHGFSCFPSFLLPLFSWKRLSRVRHRLCERGLGKWRFYHTPEGNGGARRIGGSGQLPPAWETSQIALPRHWGWWSAHPRREETSKIALSRLCLSRGFTMLLPGPVLPSEVWKNRPNTSDTTYRVPQKSLWPEQEDLSRKSSMTKIRIPVFTHARTEISSDAGIANRRHSESP